MSVSSYGGNSSRISRYSLTEDDEDEGEYEMNHHEDEQNDRISTTSIKMKRCDLLAQLEKLGYEDVPEDVVQEFIAELKSQNIEVEDEETENTTQLSSSVLTEEDSEEEVEEEEDHEDVEEEEEEQSVPVTESEQDYEEDELNAYLPEYTPILNNNNVDDEDEDGSVQIIKRNAVNESFNQHITEEDDDDDEGYDTATYYGKHYSNSLKEVDMAKDTSFNSSFSKPHIPQTNNIPTPNVYNSPSRIPTSHNKFTSPTKNHLTTPKKIETVSYPFSPNRKSQDNDDYRPLSSRDVTHHDLQTPTSKVKFKPLEERNYTPPSLPVSRPKSAPPVKTPIKESTIKTPSKSESPKDASPNTGKNSSMVRTSTSSSISYQSAKPLPFKSNVKKPVTYRKKVNDPVNRWREMNAMWKNDPFLKNQQSQQKNHRWRVRQEMLEIQGDKYLNPKESR